MCDHKVERGAAALPSGFNASQTLFAVAGGRVIVKRLLGRATTSVSATGQGTLRVDAAAGEFETLGAPVALDGATPYHGFAPSGGPWAPSGTLDVVLQWGDTVQLQISDATVSGSAAWTLVYEPLDPGATVTAV